MKKRVLSCVLALIMLFSMVPAQALGEMTPDSSGLMTLKEGLEESAPNPAAGDPAAETVGEVQVIVENQTCSEEQGAHWIGELVNRKVSLTADSTMMSCVVEALGEYSIVGAENNYISEINGLKAFTGGSGGSWMGTLNDWFTNQGFGSFTVKDGTLEDGDLIRIMYTLNYGEDLGGSWGNNETSLKDLAFSAGELSPVFNSNTKEYTLTLNADTDHVLVTPTATNKNFQVRTYLGTQETGTMYKRIHEIPVKNGDVLTVVCGDPSWPSMNSGGGKTTYTIRVKQETAEPVPEGTPITVPSDAELFVGTKTKHFVPFQEVKSTAKQENGDTTTYYYSLKEKSTYNFRVSGEDYVTYAGTFKNTDDFSMTVTKDQLTGNKHQVDHDVSSNGGQNVGDIFLNINAQGHLQIAQNDTHQIVALRNWETINGFSENYFIEPDFHYTVVNENGEESNDVVTVDKNGKLTAVGEGTAIVLVTYDAINVTSASGGPFFGAIWPENTGVFVVTVGDQSSISTNMTLNAGKNNSKYKLSGDALDAEHDVIYFIGEQGEYTFTPEAGCTVSVANPTVDDAMTFNGFVPVSANEDGSFTVPLVTGRNIVKVEKGGGAVYQVITAKEVSVTINDGKPVHPGDTVSIKFDTLYHPANKLAGVYNMGAGIQYPYEDKLLGGAPGGMGEYSFASKEKSQTLSAYTERIEKTSMWGTTVSYKQGEDFKIPEDFEGDSLTLTGGALVVLGYGDSFGNHRSITLENGKGPNMTADQLEALLGQLPDITIPIAEPESEPEPYETALKNTAGYLEQNVNNPTVGSTGGEWAVIALNRGDGTTETWNNTYLENLKKHVADCGGKLSQTDYQYTEYSRVVLALTALGEDATKFKASDNKIYDLVRPLLDTKSEGNDAGKYYPMLQGNNSVAFALIALDSAAYYDTAEGRAARAAYISNLLENQREDHMWSITSEMPFSDTDTTAMVVQALAPYYLSEERFNSLWDARTQPSYAELKAAVDQALAALQDKNENLQYSETASQIIVALSALGRDANAEDWKTVDTLLTFQADDNGFKHVSGGEVTLMSTEQAAYALAAYDRYKEGRNGLYDMSDAFQNGEKPDEVTVSEVNKLIEKIGATVDKNSGAAILAARQAYDRLSEEEKAQVTGYNTLVNAETSYAGILETVKKDALEEIEKAFGNYDEDDYSKSNWNKLKKAYEAGKTGISGAALCEDVEKTLENALKTMGDVSTGTGGSGGSGGSDDLITVTFTLLGDTKHDSDSDGDVHTLADKNLETWIKETEVKTDKGSTVRDVFEEVLEDNNYQWDNPSGNYVKSITTPDSVTIGEFTNGRLSGWMYTVNGKHPNLGLDEKTLKNGDEIVWHYTDDYTREERSWDDNSGSGGAGGGTTTDESAADKVIALIDKIGKVTLDKADEIEAARQAYDKLTASQKKQVTNYNTLQKAEEKLAELDPVGTVERLIDRIGKVTLDSGAQIDAARRAYDRLTDAQKRKVRNYNTLTSAEETLAQLRESAMSFDDIAGHWAKDEIEFVCARGLFAGTSETTFSPNQKMDRSMLVTTLYRLDGQPTVSGEMAFPDVAEGKWYHDAVLWAAQHGIVKGTDAGLFEPTRSITREEMVVILYNYAEYKGYDVKQRADLKQFADQKQIGSWAAASMQWAVAEELLHGRTETEIAPKGETTRAEVAAILMRFVQNIQK